MTKHGKTCFCTDCLEARNCGIGDEPDHDEWKRAFPTLPWDDEESVSKEPTSPQKNPG